MSNYCLFKPATQFIISNSLFKKMKTIVYFIILITICSKLIVSQIESSPKALLDMDKENLNG